MLWHLYVQLRLWLLLQINKNPPFFFCYEKHDKLIPKNIHIECFKNVLIPETTTTNHGNNMDQKKTDLTAWAFVNFSDKDLLSLLAGLLLLSASSFFGYGFGRSLDATGLFQNGFGTCWREDKDGEGREDGDSWVAEKGFGHEVS